MISVDTTVRIDYFSGIDNSETEWLDCSVGHEAIGLTDLIVCEALQGLRADEQFRAISAQLIAFDIFPAGGTELASEAASNFRELRRRGFTVRETFDSASAKVAVCCTAIAATMCSSDNWGSESFTP
jgi:predicted nucleic acid-binding protein